MKIIAILVAGAVLMTSPQVAAAEQHRLAEVAVPLRVDLVNPGPQFEGWGTALAWFAHVTGGWPDAERERLADLFYGPDGLGWTIARYNIGGGDAPETAPYLRVGANVPGFWRRPDDASGRDWWNPDDPRMWNWEADANQRWWLDAVNRRVGNPIFEAFSNSPPYFMTVSGKVSGHEDRHSDNLRPGFERAFANYLVTVTAELQKRHGITFRTLSPVNEPGTDYWHAANTQEGSHWDPASQARMIDATFEALQASGMQTVVSAPDETNSHLFVEDWEGYPATTRSRIGQLNVHSYGTLHQTAVRDIARASGIRLWMSENDTPRPGDPEDFTGMATPLAFAEHVVADIKRLEPAAWVFWQAIETLSAIDGKKGSNWGLVKADLRAAPDADHKIVVTKKYWAMMQFSQHIRPGDRLISVADEDTVGSLSADGHRLVLVHVNPGPVVRRIDLPTGWKAARFLTDARNNHACDRQFSAPARSITTFVLVKAAVDLPCP